MNIGVAYENGQIAANLGDCREVLIVTTEGREPVGKRIAGIEGSSATDLIKFAGLEQIDVLICGSLGLATRNALEMLTLPAIIQKATADDIAALRDRLHEMDGVMASRDFETLSPMARAFHRQMTEICGQNRILRVIEGQDQYITRFSSMAISQENRLLQAHEEHYKLVDYIEQRDLEHFQKLMHRHIERSKEKCLEALKTQRYLQKM